MTTRWSRRRRRLPLPDRPDVDRIEQIVAELATRLREAGARTVGGVGKIIATRRDPLAPSACGDARAHAG